MPLFQIVHSKTSWISCNQNFRFRKQNLCLLTFVTSNYQKRRPQEKTFFLCIGHGFLVSDSAQSGLSCIRHNQIVSLLLFILLFGFRKLENIWLTFEQIPLYSTKSKWFIVQQVQLSFLIRDSLDPAEKPRELGNFLIRQLNDSIGL